MQNPVRYEVHGWGSETFHQTLTSARKIARAKSKHLVPGTRYIVIYKLSIPGNRCSDSTLVERWTVDKKGKPKKV